MSDYVIVTDSSANLPDEIINKYDLKILSLRFMTEDEEYLSYENGKSADLEKFYREMREGIVFTTSLPYQDKTSDTVREVLESGNDLLYLGFSSGLSGTFEATQSIIADIIGGYPDRRAFCVDTFAASLGQGLIVYYALKMREDGCSIEEVHQWVLDHRFKLAHWFTVDDLMYLYRGGRVSRTSATAGNVLNIKPVLHVDDEGHLIPQEKVRGRKRSIQNLYQHMKQTYDPAFNPQVVGISHGDCIEDVEALKQLIESDPQFEVGEFVVNYVDSVIGAHSGPGTLALFYLGSTRN